MTSKDFVALQKQSTLDDNAGLIAEYAAEVAELEVRYCNLAEGRVSIEPCETPRDKRFWTAAVHLTTSLPYRGAVGRQLKLFVVCDSQVVGMIHLTSPLAHLRERDALLGWSDSKRKWANLNSVYNMQICVPLRRYAQLLTGKLLVYAAYSREVRSLLKQKYACEVLGIEVTSLYGKSSMYNRIPFLKYLGTTQGLSALHISARDWQQILSDYRGKFPDTKTSRIAPAKFQIVDKLTSWYSSRAMEFPFTVQQTEFQRGVYFGFLPQNSPSVDERVQQWRDRWLFPRAERLTANGIRVPPYTDADAEDVL